MSDEQGSYLIIAPNRPTPEEYKRGARLIPSMMDPPDSILVWRAPVATLVEQEGK